MAQDVAEFSRKLQLRKGRAVREIKKLQQLLSSVSQRLDDDDYDEAIGEAEHIDNCFLITVLLRAKDFFYNQEEGI